MHGRTQTAENSKWRQTWLQARKHAGKNGAKEKTPGQPTQVSQVSQGPIKLANTSIITTGSITSPTTNYYYYYS